MSRSPSLGTMVRSCTCLMCLDVGAVYTDVLQVGVLTQFMEYLLDQAAFRPFPEPLVHRLRWPVPLRQVPPRHPASCDAEDSVQHLPGFPPRSPLVTHLPFWEIGFQSLPLGVCQFVPSNYSCNGSSPHQLYSIFIPVFHLVLLLYLHIFSASAQTYVLETHARLTARYPTVPSFLCSIPAIQIPIVDLILYISRD